MLIRLALREEGNMWNAYIARMDTMEGAKLIGSIVMGAVTESPEVKDAFMHAMRMALAHAIKQTTGQDVDDWKTVSAPDSERRGRN